MAPENVVTINQFLRSRVLVVSLTHIEGTASAGANLLRVR